MPNAVELLARFHELAPGWESSKSGVSLASLSKGLITNGFDGADVDSTIEALIGAGAVKSPNGKTLYPSERVRIKSLKWDEAERLRLDATDKRKALRRAIKDTPRIERRFLYAGVLPKAIADDPTLNVYARMAAVVIDDRIHNFPKHQRRNRTISLAELAERMGRVSKATAGKAVQDLIDGTYLYVDEPGGGRRGTLYGFMPEIEAYGRDDSDG